MDLPIRMRIFSKVKDRYLICFKFGDKFLTFLTKLVFKNKISICSTIKKKKSYFYIVVSFRYLFSMSSFNIFLKQGLYHKETQRSLYKTVWQTLIVSCYKELIDSLTKWLTYITCDLLFLYTSCKFKDY